MKLKFNLIFAISLLFAVQTFGQNKINDPRLSEYRKAYPELDTLMKKGILTEDVTGMKYFTGYSYKTLYDWDQYFESIVQIYMGWPSDYIKNGVIIFLKNQKDNGFIARSVPSNEWHDPEHVKPFLAQISCLVYEAYGEKDWILKEPYFTKLKKYLDYWLVDMDINKNGLSEWMSAPHTGMDNQHERAGFWLDRGCEGVDLNSYLVKECRAFARLAKLAGKDKMAKEYEQKAQDKINTIQTLLWDEKDGFFYDRKVDKDKPLSKTVWAYNQMNARCMNQYKIPVRSVAAFTTLWAGVATPEQAKRMVNEYLLNPREFWTPYPITTLAKSEPGYTSIYQVTDNGCSWRTTTWIPTNYMVYNGLKLYGYNQIATVVAQRTVELMQKAGNREYYNTETGEGLGLDPFWGWSLLGHFFMLEEKLDWNINKY
jgi:putative isomerase